MVKMNKNKRGKPKKIAILVLNWNGLKDTLQCLLSIFASSYPYYRVFVLDNGSAKNEALIIKKEFNKVLALRSEKNLGFCGGSNFLLRRVLKKNFDYVLFLNNDASLEKNALQNMLFAAESNPKIGIVGPVIYDYEMHSLVSAGYAVNLWRGLSLPLSNLDKNPVNVAAVSGCCMLVKKNVFLDSGYFYEDYFAYFEDTEFCLISQRKGYRIVCASSAHIYHDSRLWFKRQRFLQIYRLFVRNRFLFVHRNAPVFYQYVFVFHMFFFELPKHVFYTVYLRRPQLLISFLLGISDFYSKTPLNNILRRVSLLE